MDLGLMNKNLTEDNYDEYVEKIVNIFRLSSKKSSIIFEVKIKDYQADVCLSIVSQDGRREDFQDLALKCDESFYNHFLMSVLQSIDQNTDVKVRDIVKNENSSLVTLRIINDNNDLFTIDGLSEDDARYLLSKLGEIKESDNEKLMIVSDNIGASNAVMFFIMTIILVIAFILIVVFLG